MRSLVTLSTGHRGVIRPLEDTLRGDQVLSMRPDAHEMVGRSIGATLKALEMVPARGPALGVDGTRFVATGADLADAILLRAGQALALSSRAGVAPSSHLTDALKALESVLPAVGGPCVLSHGTLGPEALNFEMQAGELKLRSVSGWDGAAACTAGRDWARVLDLPKMTLAAVLDGYGEGMDAWRSEDSLRALRAWHLLLAMERFGQISDVLLSGADPNAGGLVQHACLLLERALEPSFVSSQLSGAMEVSATDSVAPSGLRPDPLLANLHRTAIDGTRGVHRTAEQYRLWTAGLAADLLWLETPEESRSSLVGVGEAAQYARHQLLTRRSVPAASPIYDRSAWWASIEASILDAADDRAWVMLWCLRDADQALEGRLSDGVLRAAEAAMWRQSSLGPSWSDDTPAFRAGRAALAAGALMAFGRSDEAEEWAYRVQDAVDACVMDPSAMGQTEAEDVPNLIGAMQSSARRALLAPLLARVLMRISLPVSWSALAAHAQW